MTSDHVHDHNHNQARHDQAHDDQAHIDAVLAFWLGAAPARTAAELEAKIKRWFQTGPALDPEIIERFGSLVAAALSGELDGWTETTRGHLALTLLLDQYTRHAYRGRSRMYAGDAKAQLLATDAYDRGLEIGLNVEEELFLFMPFAHAENRTLQARSVAVNRAIADKARPELKPPLELGYERVLTYHAIISRFGRFPHRNELLGRVSTPDERAFLDELGRRSV